MKSEAPCEICGGHEGKHVPTIGRPVGFHSPINAPKSEAQIEEILDKLTGESYGEVFGKPEATQAILQLLKAERIDELEEFEPLQQDHLNCPLPMTCIGYQNAVSDFDNEKQLRIKELQDENSN